MLPKTGGDMDFEILNYRKVQNGSSIISEFSVKITKWGLTFFKLKQIQAKNGGSFIAGPSEKYKNAQGEEKYSKYWMFDKETDERFQTAVKRALEEFLADRPDVETKRNMDEEVPF